MRFLRDLRLIPIVALAAAALFMLKVSAIEGGEPNRPAGIMPSGGRASCRMLEKNAGAPGTWVVEYWVKRGYCLHSSARRVVALTAAGFVITVEVKNFGVDEGEDRDLIFVKGDVSIKNETSVNAANPPTVSHCHMKRNLITHI